MGESQLELLERLLTRIDQYGHEVTRTQLEADLDTWLKVENKSTLREFGRVAAAELGGE